MQRPADEKNYNILVVEDNPGDFALVEDFLSGQPDRFVLSQARTFKQTRKDLTDHTTIFDIVLLDLSLPDKQGFELINEIVALNINVPIIVLTGYADISFGVKSLALGMADYLLKDDLTPTTLYKSIVYSCERKKANLALEISQKKYSELFHLSPLPMLVFDMHTNEFLDINKAAIMQYGYSHEEFLNMKVWDISPANEIAVIKKALNCHECGINQQGTYIHKKKNGDLIKADIQSNNIDFKGRSAKLILASDVTDRLNYIKAIEVQNEKLTEISWVQSHLVRAPVARILGLIQLFADNENHEEKLLLTKYLLKSALELDGVIKKITDTTCAIIDDNEIKTELLSLLQL